MTQRRYASRATPFVAVGVALVAATPWPLGSRFAWAVLGIAALVFGAAATWVSPESMRRSLNSRTARAIGAYLLWVAILWVTGRTIYPYGTQIGWLEFATYGVIFGVLSDAFACRWRRVGLLLGAMLVSAILVQLFAIYQWYAWDGRMIWNYEPPFGGTSPFGPFNNRNHYAGYAIATLGPALGLAALGRGPWRAVGIIGAALTGAGILLSLSRGGYLAMFSVVAAVLLAVAARRDPAQRGRRVRQTALVLLGLAAIAAITVAGLVWFAPDSDVAARLATLTRPFTERSAEGRLHIWADTLSMIAARPIGGWGLNTFAWSHLRFRTSGDNSMPQHAHNEYLEITAETGLVGAGICAWFLWSLLGTMRQRVRMSTGRFEYGVRAGALASWVGILVLALTDFPTVIPATNLVLAVLAAVGVASPSPEDGSD